MCTKDDIRLLAIAYHTYYETMGNEERCRYWSAQLLRAQRATGVELIVTDALLYPMAQEPRYPDGALNDMPSPLDDYPTPAPLDGPPVKTWRRSSDGFSGGATVVKPVPAPRTPSPAGAVANAATAFFAKGRA